MGVVFFKNPIYSALSLVAAMSGIAGLFFNLGAYFLAGVQLLVYAGAVVVLFVMIVMLFNLRQELKLISSGKLNLVFEIFVVGIFLGLMVVGADMSVDLALQKESVEAATADATREIAKLLFSRDAFYFEIISVLLLVVVVGVIALAKHEGGSHA